MLIKYYKRDKTGEEQFGVKKIPDNLQDIDVEYYAKNSNNTIGYITFYWLIGDNIDASSESIGFTDDINYIEVNEKDKFIIRNKNDIFKLFEYFTNINADSFIKQFKIEEKLKDAKSDFV